MKRALGSLGIAAIVALAAGSALPAMAQDGGPDGEAAFPACPDPAVQVVAAALELNAQQLRTWIAILTVRNAALAPLAVQVQLRRQALAAQLESGNPDPNVVGHIFIEIHALEAQVQAVQAEGRARFGELLTPPQARKLALIRQGAGVCSVVPAFAAVSLIPDAPLD